MSHTPGPWFHSCDEGGQWCNINTPEAGVIGEAYFDTDRRVSEANARLMAAAPKLAEALSGLLALHQDYCIEKRCKDQTCGEGTEAAIAALDAAYGLPT